MWKQHKYLSTHKWVKKIELYRCGAIKNEILPFEATWMDLEGIMPSEMSDREGQMLYDTTYRWDLKNTTI